MPTLSDYSKFTRMLHTGKSFQNKCLRKCKKYDGCYTIYKIENNLIYNHQVSKSQSFRDQQMQGRRPRFSIIKELIVPNKIQPIIKSSL